MNPLQLNGRALNFRSLGSRFELWQMHFLVLFFMLIFFYLTTIIAYRQSYFSYLISFLKHSKLAKVISQGGHPSKFQRIFPLTDLQIFLKKLKKSTCCLVLLANKVLNNVRTTIIYYIEEISRFHQVPQRHNMAKTIDFLGYFYTQVQTKRYLN